MGFYLNKVVPNILDMKVTMLRAAVFLLALVFSLNSSHAWRAGVRKKNAECFVQFHVRKGCGEVQDLIADKVREWNEDLCAEDPDHHCWYHDLVENPFRPNMLQFQHTTNLRPVERPDDHIVDNVGMAFAPWRELGESGWETVGCRITGLSQAPQNFTFDYGTNYCNLWNLVEGIGLTNVEENGEDYFSETTNMMLCTWYKPGLKMICPQRNCCMQGERHQYKGKGDPEKQTDDTEGIASAKANVKNV